MSSSSAHKSPTLDDSLGNLRTKHVSSIKSPGFIPLKREGSIRSIMRSTLPLDEISQDHSVLRIAGDSTPVAVVRNFKDGESGKSCLMINTGGAIGMAPDTNGVLCPQSGVLSCKLAKMDEFSQPNMPNVDVLEFDNPLDSSDMTVDSWSAVARVINNFYFDYEGFVVLHGTDTMAYGASCLSFMLQNLGKTVVFCGSTIPLIYSHSDARRNIVMSVIASTALEIPEVCLYTDNRLFRGNRTSGSHSTAFDSFYSPKLQPVAKMADQMVVSTNILLPPPRCRFSINTNMHTAMCVYHVVPGFDDDCIHSYIQRAGVTASRRDHALVLLLYGTGNAPVMREGFLKAVRSAVDVGMPVVVGSQCPGGPVKLSTYSTGVQLQKMGVISAGDMTVEATVMKLAYLMGQGFRGPELKLRMETNLVGELTEELLGNGEMEASVHYGSRVRNRNRVYVPFPEISLE